MIFKYCLFSYFLIIAILVYLLALRFVSGDFLLYMRRNNFFIFALAVCIFSAFSAINSTPNKIVNQISACMIGVYLIHFHPLVFWYLSTISLISPTDSSLLPKLFFACVVIFVVCTLIELCRRQITKPLAKLLFKHTLPYDEKIADFLKH
jgi:hypothetical protein